MPPKEISPDEKEALFMRRESDFRAELSRDTQSRIYTVKQESKLKIQLTNLFL
jgi:hypothetical protein